MEYDYAIVNYNKAIELDPAYAEFYYNRGFARYKMKDYDLAISDWDKCISLNPDNAKELNSKIKAAKEKLNK
jgi:tetratricopeptide (TPR) repeat protein